MISNAIKFTKNGGEVKVYTKECEKENDKYILIVVEDSGVGMNKENLSKLFSADTNFSKSGTNGEKGTGLGLIICKEFVEKNGGKIEVESEEGVGTKFKVYLGLTE